jgi:hypothetical protein
MQLLVEKQFVEYNWVEISGEFLITENSQGQNSPEIEIS